MKRTDGSCESPSQRRRSGAARGIDPPESAVAKLDSSVVADGDLSIEGNRSRLPILVPCHRGCSDRAARAAGCRVGRVVVTRPTKWGNPHPLELGRAEAVRRYSGTCRPGVLRSPWTTCGESSVDKATACYARPDEPCHADVLLAIANK